MWKIFFREPKPSDDNISDERSKPIEDKGEIKSPEQLLKYHINPYAFGAAGHVPGPGSVEAQLYNFLANMYTTEGVKGLTRQEIVDTGTGGLASTDQRLKDMAEQAIDTLLNPKDKTVKPLFAIGRRQNFPQ
jgi:hypothetical protein